MSEPRTQHTYTTIPRWTMPLDEKQGVAEHGEELPASLTRALEEHAAVMGAGLPAVLLAAHARVMATVASEPDLLIGLAPSAGRAEATLRLTVADGTWTELTDRAGAALGAAHRAEGRPEVVFDLSGLAAQDTGAPDGGIGAGPQADGLDSGVVLRAAVTREHGGLSLRLMYDRAHLDEGYARRLAGYHLRALHLLAADPHGLHHRQSLLSAEEADTQLYGLAGPRAGLSDGTFVDHFEEQVRKSPDAVAAVHGPLRLTYRELDRAANRVANALLAAGVRAEDVVAVVMDRTLDWIAAALGVFKAGGVYLPVRPDFPADRVAAQLRRSDCAFVLTEPGSADLVALAGELTGREPYVLAVPEIQASDVSAEAPGLPIAPGRAAYIYFTSGSTGAPKGALCEHVGMLNHLHMKIDDMEMTNGAAEVVTQTASQCFDISLWQFAAPLLVGGSVRVVDTDVLLDVAGFVDEIVTGRVTVTQIVPSYLEVLLTHLEQHPRPLGALRAVSVTGEALKYELVQRWFALYPDIRLVNAYGATEVSDDTMHEVLDRVPDRDFVTVGRSLRNVNTYVLDENLALVPLGSPGEIAFSGVCVGRGYINDDERTREAFVPDPFRPGTRMYRTGDFGRWLPEGRIEYLGRRDEQVKIRGFRIEIGEIENKLLGMPGVREAAVVIDGSGDGPRNLVAFFSGGDGGVGSGTETGAEAVTERARDFLARQLPEYMVPTYFHQLERLPLTENGKIDKKALVRLAGTLGHGGATYAAPGTSAEQRLAMLWAQVLGVPLERIGRDDNFFELGGTSLAAVRLLVQLDRALSLKDLVAHPVLAELATVLTEHDRGGERAATNGLLQPLAAARNPHRTLVCFPYAGGNAVNFRSLAAELETDGIAVLGVELPGHDFAGAEEPMAEIPEIARRVRDEIAERVTTPVLLWGHCAGAAAALETARLLQEAGRAAERVFVGALLLEDTDALRAEMADVSGADNRALLSRLRADNAYVELDELKPERADVVGRAYRHDVLTANSHLIRIREDSESHRIDAPLEVVVARDDASTAHFAEGHGDWKAVSDRVTLHELDQGGHYFVSTRPADTAALVRAGCPGTEHRN
ncbi:non-ribosomal peptide synthetase [Streptomyces griseorubiginosus]|uniref:non-ribosomal peptide synthetase n=1 Tax=Streptomyces griseorubiginosus TaxID=67304 RepID=UPI001AD76CE1|nr:amino acid adenylation domain-containing protein [Streptomyces griseorubiginosus]MBO4254986.1 amino acid adenylation domain-containing protein [Streptomyces griseorubiginosus]